MNLFGKFLIYVDTHRPDAPWVVRYEDPGSIHGFNEVRVKGFTCNVPCYDYTDPFNEAKIGKYMLEIRNAACVIDENNTAKFDHYV